MTALECARMNVRVAGVVHVPWGLPVTLPGGAEEFVFLRCEKEEAVASMYGRHTLARSVYARPAASVEYLDAPLTCLACIEGSMTRPS